MVGGVAVLAQKDNATAVEETGVEVVVTTVAGLRPSLYTVVVVVIVDTEATQETDRA